MIPVLKLAHTCLHYKIGAEYKMLWDKGRVQKPQSRLFAVMGVPPLPPSRQAAGQKINGKKITAKGDTPPPSRQAAWNFFAKSGVFCPIFNRFFNHGKGGYPPPPHHGKRPAKKLTEKKITAKGGTPPLPITAKSRDWGF